MALVTEIGTLIDRDPDIRGGRPKIAGTGLTVSRIAGWYKMGMTPEEIALEYPHLTLAQVHAALAYSRTRESCINCGADPLVSAGPPGPALCQGYQSHPTASRPRWASAADQGSAPQFIQMFCSGKSMRAQAAILPHNPHAEI